MILLKAEVLPIRTETDVVKVRHSVRDWSVACKFGLVDQTKFVTAASELARNTLTYGQGGDLTLELLSDGLRNGVRLTFVDQGPGIADLELALTDGYTSGGGMGLGLSGAKRLSDEFSISSHPGEGTKVAITRWKAV